MARENAFVGLVAIKVVIFAHAVVRVLKREDIEAGMRATFGMGIAIPFLVLFLPVGAWLLLR
jgi:hypothetical protein